jgi:acylglycerol lipase
MRAKYDGPHILVHTSDGKTLFVRQWPAAREPTVCVLIFHGITAYSGPYGPMIAEQLAASGYCVYGLDLRGHGLSDGRRGDYPSKERLIHDLSETIEKVRSESKGKKLVVLGHSLGALSAIIALNSNPDKIDGMVLLSSAKKVRTGQYQKPTIAQLIRLLFAVSLLRGTSLIEYRREGMIGLDDPLFNFKYSARFYSVMYGVGALAVSRMFRSGVINSPNLRFREKLRIPLLVGVGENDELFTPQFVKEFFDEIDCDRKQFFVIPGARHAVFPKDSWGPLASWLAKDF